MATNNITVTGPTGPASTVTSQVFNDVSDLNFNLSSQVLKIMSGVKVTDIDLNGIATVTYTVSSHIATVAVS